MLVIGLDPGEVSGLVLAHVAGREVIVVDEWAELKQLVTTRWLRDRVGAVDTVVCERWVPRGGAHSFKPYSLELIGWTRGLCWEHLVPLVLQPAVMKNRFHDAAREQFPDVGRGQGGHARDALAHVIGWANTRRLE